MLSEKWSWRISAAVLGMVIAFLVLAMPVLLSGGGR